MKPKVTLLSIAIATMAQTLTAQPSLEWAVSLGGNSLDQGYSIAVDNIGNVYTTGYFQGTADFDPGPGVYNLTSSGTWDGYISKLDASGNMVWTVSFGSSNWDQGQSIETDNSGNIYTTGWFEGVVDFDPGPGVYNLTSAGAKDIFIYKLDTAGNFVWAKSLGGTLDDRAFSIALDAMHNVYVTGNFEGTADFDPGTAVFNLTSVGTLDNFIAKLDASGNFVWAKSFGGTDIDWSHEIATDASGNIYTTGSFKETVDFDPGPGVYNLISSGEDDGFILKLNSSGNFIWAISFGSVEWDASNSITIDSTGNIYTIGSFYQTVDFDPGPGVFNLTSLGDGDMYICKLDSSGDFIWARTQGGINYEFGSSITLDNSGSIYTTGSFNGVTDFDPGTGVYNLSSVGLSDIFICKLDTLGNFVWAKAFGSAGSETGIGITADASGNIYSTGGFRSTIDFDPGPGVFNLTSVAHLDIFVLKLSTSTTGISENNLGQITLFPNPTNGKVTINSNNASGIDAIIIRDISGKEVFVKNFSSAKQIEFTLEGTNGLYFAEIISGDNKSHAKVIKE